MIKPFEAFCFYNAIKLHFSSASYDAIKYNFKTSVKEQAFLKRKDRFFFGKISKRFNDADELKNYFVSHFVDGSPWIGEIINNDSVWDEWRKRFEAFGYHFKNDITMLEVEYGSFDAIFAVPAGKTFPPIISHMIAGDINVETVVVFEKMFGLMDRLDYQIADKVVWPQYRDKVKKYAPFLRVDMKKMKEVTQSVFTS